METPMARPRKPTILHALEGTRPTWRPSAREPRPNGNPRLPSGDVLDTEQRALWKAIVQMSPPGLLTQADESTIERMSVAWAAFRAATRGLAKTGHVVKGRDGLDVRNPWALVQRQASAEMHRAGESLGLSPAARTRLTMPEKQDDDPLAILLGPAGKAWSDDPVH